MKASGRNEAWKRSLTTTAKGKPKLSLANVAMALREAPEWAGAFAFNTFGQRIEIRRDTPAGRKGCQFSDHTLSKVKVWLDANAGLDASPETILRAIELVAREHEFHPVCEELKALRWDGVQRLPTWLHAYLGAEDTSLNAAFGTRWLISAVARAFAPGCKADHVLILEGPQGRGKSTALSVLGGPWYSDDIGDVGTKDAQHALQGAWIVELSELDALSRADAAAVKAFLTRTKDRFRPPYGKIPQDFPRQAVFAGTVNHGSYLRDETGNRRFWPVTVGSIDLQALRRDRDQLWAEARARYESGEQWWLTWDEERLAGAAQDERFAADEWETLIERHLVGKQECTARDIMAHVLKLDPSAWGQREQMRVGKVLTRLGWQRRQRRHAGVREYYYTRAAADPPSPPSPPHSPERERDERTPERSLNPPPTGGDADDANAEEPASHARIPLAGDSR